MLWRPAGGARTAEFAATAANNTSASACAAAGRAHVRPSALPAGGAMGAPSALLGTARATRAASTGRPAGGAGTAASAASAARSASASARAAAGRARVRPRALSNTWTTFEHIELFVFYILRLSTCMFWTQIFLNGKT